MCSLLILNWCPLRQHEGQRGLVSAGHWGILEGMSLTQRPGDAGARRKEYEYPQMHADGHRWTQMIDGGRGRKMKGRKGCGEENWQTTNGHEYTRMNNRRHEEKNLPTTDAHGWMTKAVGNLCLSVFICG
jgi:hypothetical protein